MKKVTAKKTTKKMKNGSAWIVMSPGMSMVKIAGLCDICSRKYHLQCSGIQYGAEKYWTLDLDVYFVCDECS